VEVCMCATIAMGYNLHSTLSISHVFFLNVSPAGLLYRNGVTNYNDVILSMTLLAIAMSMI